MIKKTTILWMTMMVLSASAHAATPSSEAVREQYVDCIEKARTSKALDVCSTKFKAATKAMESTAVKKPDLSSDVLRQPSPAK